MLQYKYSSNNDNRIVIVVIIVIIVILVIIWYNSIGVGQFCPPLDDVSYEYIYIYIYIHYHHNDNDNDFDNDNIISVVLLIISIIMGWVGVAPPPDGVFVGEVFFVCLFLFSPNETCLQQLQGRGSLFSG